MEQVATMVVVRETWGGCKICCRPVEECGGSVLHMVVPVLKSSLRRYSMYSELWSFLNTLR